MSTFSGEATLPGPKVIELFSSPGQSPGRAIVLPPVLESAAAAALTKSLT